MSEENAKKLEHLDNIIKACKEALADTDMDGKSDFAQHKHVYDQGAAIIGKAILMLGEHDRRSNRNGVETIEKSFSGSDLADGDLSNRKAGNAQKIFSEVLEHATTLKAEAEKNGAFGIGDKAEKAQKSLSKAINDDLKDITEASAKALNKIAKKSGLSDVSDNLRESGLQEHDLGYAFTPSAEGQSPDQAASLT